MVYFKRAWYYLYVDQFVLSQTEKEQLERLDVEALILFGSRAQGLARIGSDYDFGVLVKNKNVLKLYEQRKNIYNNTYN